MGKALRRMRTRLWQSLRAPLIIVGVLLAGGAALADNDLRAQGMTTAAIRGTVRMADGSDPEGARVLVLNTATGFRLETEVRRGQFVVQGLEAGGPYAVTVRRIGAVAQRWDRVFLNVGELELHIELEPLAFSLDSLVVVADAPAPLSCCHGGTGTTLSDSLIHHLPSLNRDVYDFVRLVPQISTRIGLDAGGISGGGSNFRFNSFLTNGVSERSVGGSQPPEFAAGRSLPFEAVKEYQALLAPFDVRYADFTGALVNTVTRSGTNEFHGSAFAFGRNDDLAQGGDLAASPYERWQFGGSASGPILRDRLHFFVASEVEREESPMAGPYVGQPADAEVPVPVSEADLARLEALHDRYGLAAGSAGAVENRNRVRSLFARLDASLPEWNTRAVLWVNDSRTRVRGFDRGTAPQEFLLSSTLVETDFGPRTLALQVYTALPRRGGGHNELSVSHRRITFSNARGTPQPVLQVITPALPSGLTTVVTGAGDEALGTMATRDIIVRDDLTLPLGSSHVASFGVQAEWFRIGLTDGPDALGVWTFSSLDDLENGEAERYEITRDFGVDSAPITGAQFGLYAGDLWRASERVTLTLGLRADLLAPNGRAPYNQLIDSVFGRRTDEPLPESLTLSPRVGFTWDLGGKRDHQLRGGVGLFVARPPIAWYHVPLGNYGEDIGRLRCGDQVGDLGAPPPFTDPFDPPLACANGAGLDAPPPGDVDLVAKDLDMSRALRGVLAYERRLPGGLVGTLEGLATRQLSDFNFVQLNLAGPRGTDRHGRVLYGTFDTLGAARPDRVVTSPRNVVELQNVSRNHALQLSASLARQFEGGLSAMASYTWSRVRDVASPLRVNFAGAENWSSRAISGRHDDPRPGISINDVPHRLVLAGTWRAPWRRWLTELSVLYVGESGGPFTYRVGGVSGRGDLNADGALNDPIYVPRSAIDPAEIRFTGISTRPGDDNSQPAQADRVRRQREVFEQFIAGSDCLRRQRGRIMVRNTCREPWTHTTAASLRQMIPIGGRVLEAQLDVFNLLNLVDGGWGLRRRVNPVILDHVGQEEVAPGDSEPVFRLRETALDRIVDPAQSAFQLQFGVRYRF